MTAITRILVPTDFSETSDAALDYAKELAATLGASIHLVHVFEDPYRVAAFAPEVYGGVSPGLREAAIARAERELRARVPESFDLLTGPTAQAIVDCAAERGADLIVMGTHGRTALAHLVLGSVAEHVVRTARCPVLTIRPRSRDRAHAVPELAEATA